MSEASPNPYSDPSHQTKGSLPLLYQLMRPLISKEHTLYYMIDMVKLRFCVIDPVEQLI